MVCVVSSLAPMSRHQRLSFPGIAAVIAVVAIIILTTWGGSDDGAGDSANNVSFKATIPGIFEIELEGSAEQIGELRVDPK